MVAIRWLAALSFAIAARTEAHPLHTTLTEVSVSSRSVRATVRLFADDLTAALAKRHGNVASDSVVLAYVASAVVVIDDGAAVGTHGCGVRRAGEVLWVCVEGMTSANLERLSLRNAVLCETFSDQVNIVQVAAGGTKRSVLFTRGDGAKRLF